MSRLKVGNSVGSRQSDAENSNIRFPSRKSETQLSNIRVPTRKSEIENANIRLPKSEVGYSESEYPKSDVGSRIFIFGSLCRPMVIQIRITLGRPIINSSIRSETSVYIEFNEIKNTDRTPQLRRSVLYITARKNGQLRKIELVNFFILWRMVLSAGSAVNGKKTLLDKCRE